MRHAAPILFVLVLMGCSGPTAETTPQSTLLLPATSTPAAEAVALEDLETSALNDGNTWRAVVTVSVVDESGEPIAGVEVNGRWSEDDEWAASCITGADGACDIESDSIRKRVPSVELEILDLEHAELAYDPARNATDEPTEPAVVVSKP